MKFPFKLGIFIILTFIVISIIVDMQYVKKTNKLLQASHELERHISQSNWLGAEKQASVLYEAWERQKKIWLFTIDHETIDQIDQCIERINQMIKYNERSIALLYLSDLNYYIHDIPNEQKVHLVNIL